MDELGGLDRAVAIAKERAKVPASAEVEIVVYPPKPSLFEAISHPFGSSDDSSETRTALALLRPAERRVIAQLLAPMRLLTRREPLALMPFVFVH